MKICTFSRQRISLYLISENMFRPNFALSNERSYEIDLTLSRIPGNLSIPVYFDESMLLITSFRAGMLSYHKLS